MTFGEKLKKLRKDNHFSQVELAKRIGITSRTLQNYEAGKMYPKKGEVYINISNVFNISTDYLLNDEDKFIIETTKRGTMKDKQKDVNKIISDVASMFSGGDISQDDKDKFMKAISDIYWKAKEKNRKYAPKKFNGSNNLD